VLLDCGFPRKMRAPRNDGKKLMTDKPQLHPGLKLALDVGPLVLFFVANARFGIFVATAAFMAAVFVALGASYAMIRRLPIMPVISAAIVLVFGTLTLVLHDDTFIKLKPTIIYALFGLTLLGGYFFEKPLLEMVFDSVFHIDEEGWRKLTLRWAVFFLAMAVLNEFVWRTQSTDFWVSFKLLGFIPLTFLFGLAQLPLLNRHALEDKKRTE
jgi:intracellular septation protein